MGHIGRHGLIELHSNPPRLKSATWRTYAKGDLGVGARGVGAAMAEVVADLLERQAFGHQVSRACVAQRVGSLSGKANIQGPHA